MESSPNTEARNVRASGASVHHSEESDSGAGQYRPASLTGKPMTPPLITPVDGGHSSDAALTAGFQTRH